VVRSDIHRRPMAVPMTAPRRAAPEKTSVPGASVWPARETPASPTMELQRMKGGVAWRDPAEHDKQRRQKHSATNSGKTRKKPRGGDEQPVNTKYACDPSTSSPPAKAVTKEGIVSFSSIR
jgi:hypothetical protein